jgi:hypothetical protein
MDMSMNQFYQKKLFAAMPEQAIMTAYQNAKLEIVVWNTFAPLLVYNPFDDRLIPVIGVIP